jgi:hypothetical protein
LRAQREQAVKQGLAVTQSRSGLLRLSARLSVARPDFLWVIGRAGAAAIHHVESGLGLLQAQRQPRSSALRLFGLGNVLLS